MKQKIIFLSDINFKDSPTVRDHIDDETVKRYSRNYQEKRPMPPIVVFWDKDKKKTYLADGSHRCAGVALAGRKGVDAEIHEGTYEDALRYALLANSAHGLPRSNADKRKCIAVALKQWEEYSNVHIAKTCDVDDHTVASVREELEKAKIIKPTEKRIAATGESRPATRPPEEPRKSEDKAKSEKKEKSAAPVDRHGNEIPKLVQPYWNRAIEVKEMMDAVASLMSQLKKAEVEQDLMFSQVNIGATLADLSQVRSNIECAIPYCICTQCQGHPEVQPKGQCRLCSGLGLISKFRWDRLVPAEIKAMVAKAK